VKKVCVVTGSRAEYGLLRWVMEGVRASSRLQLQVVATGAHLSPEFGLTYREIEADGFRIDRKVEMLLSSDSAIGVSKSTALAIAGCAEAFGELAPEIIVLLGDRYEVLAAATAGMLARIPIAHVHGGERTEGAIDEAIRHAVTKMSQLHFVAAETYRRRVIQLGESPDRVFTVGGLGIDNLIRLPLLDREALEASLGFSLGRRSLLVTFHPATLQRSSAGEQMAELLAALEDLADTNVVFTMPNADPDGRVLFEMIESFVARHPARSKAFTSLGQQRYLSTLAQVDAVVGNSSSGVIEAPTLRKATVNIGDRQDGRLKAASVIDASPTRSAIAAAIAEARSDRFRARLATVTNPYGEGGASQRVVEALERFPLDGLLKKHFHDVEFAIP
jgi:GDP/UDP-N,N'-diacetylbacillosamine 2-epimerase (hydrolysing)